MIRFITLFTTGLLLLAAGVRSIAQEKNITYGCRLYKSYQLGQMDEWLEVLTQLERDYSFTPSNEILYDIVQLQYGYIGYLLGIKNKKQAGKVLSKALEESEILLAEQPQSANSMALNAALMAYQIALTPYKAPFIGPKITNAIDKSLAINPNAPQALLEKANSAHYAPSMFGGNPAEAIIYYKKAISVMEKLNGGEAPQSWLYLNAYVQLALAYEKAEQQEKAKSAYIHILKIAPNFKWVKEDVFPSFLKRFK